MEHLSIDEMIEFVSANEINGQSIELAKKVNGHIRTCAECFNKVRAFQIVYDEFKRIGSDENFKKYLLKKITTEEIQSENSLEVVQDENNEFDGYR